MNIILDDRFLVEPQADPRQPGLLSGFRRKFLIALCIAILAISMATLAAAHTSRAGSMGQTKNVAAYQARSALNSSYR